MQRLTLDRCQPGFTLAKPAVDDRGRTLIAAGTELTEAHLAQLRRRDVSHVTVAGNPVAEDGGQGDYSPEARLAFLDAAFARHGDDAFMARVKQAFVDQVGREVARRREAAEREAALRMGGVEAPDGAESGPPAAPADENPVAGAP